MEKVAERRMARRFFFYALPAARISTICSAPEIAWEVDSRYGIGNGDPSNQNPLGGTPPLARANLHHKNCEHRDAAPEVLRADDKRIKMRLNLKFTYCGGWTVLTIL